MKIKKMSYLATAIALTGLAGAVKAATANPDDAILSVPGLMPSATLEMTDEPGLWFKDPVDGDALVVIKPGQAVQVKMSDTNTEHTITSLLWPADAKEFPVDQEQASSASITKALDKPGLYVFTCKVHPYMFGAVVVDDPKTEGLDIGSELQLVTGAKVPADSDIAKRLLRTFFVVTTPSLWRDYRETEWKVSLPDIPLNIKGQTISLSALSLSMPNKLFDPVTPGVGEIWVDTQFEMIEGKEKPGTATRIDAANWELVNKVKGVEQDMNHPHNMWPDKRYQYIYQTQWFDKKLATFDRASGKITANVVVGQSPSHVLTRPTDDKLYVAINAGEQVVKLNGGKNPTPLSSINTGPHTAPHGHFITDDGKYMVTPNAMAGSVSVVDLDSEKNTEIPTGGVIPIAVWGTPDGQHAYTANLLGTPPFLSSLTVIDIPGKKKLADINLAEDYDPVSGKISGEAYGLLPIQTPVSPDGKYVVTANTLSMSITIVDTSTNKVVKSLPCEAGCHGIHFGMKKGGGYYAYVASKFANNLIVVDMDKLEVAGHILLADAEDSSILAHNGMGGQGVLPLPLVEHGYLKETLKLSGKKELSSEVEGWLKQLTKEQKGI
ncbi:MAG: YVTN family beta-propeller repeat protein [Gammaproteobacteria bacterium]